MLAATLCLVASPSAGAEEKNVTSAPRAGAQHEGFYGRVNANANYLSLTLSDARNELTVSGIGTGFSLAAGHSVAKNLFLFGEFGYDLAFNPTLSSGGRSVDTEDSSLSFLSVGPGAAYYLPSDIYLLATVSWSSVSMNSDGGDSEPLTGFGVKVGAGKEWTMSDSVALGLGANLFMGSVSHEDFEDDVDAATMGIGLSFSGVYN